MVTVTAEPELPTYEGFAREQWPALYRYAYLLTGHHADAEDLAQQTLLKAYGAWSKVRRADSPTAYLRRTLTNTFVSDRRPKRRRLELLTDSPPDRAQPSHQDPDERMALWPHVRDLPPRQRAVVVLRYYEDLSEREIAATLGCSTGTVKSTAHHALRALRAAVGGPENVASSDTSSDMTHGKEK